MASTRKPRPSDVAGCAAAAVRAHVPHGAHVVAGCSGGVDSMVLLRVLARLAPAHPFSLSALHVHHGLSPNADAWAAFCAARAHELGVPLAVERVRVDPAAGLGIEGGARAARYAAYMASGADIIALAHHRDDQAETLLLQLVRGAGVPGLAGMPVWRAGQGGPAIVRPLLDVPRAAILDYARGNGLAWIEDESNQDVRYARNFVRHSVLPALATLNPAAAGNIARSAGHLAEALALADGIGRSDLVAADGPAGLRVDALAALGSARAKNVLRIVLEDARLPVPDAAALEELLIQLVEAREDAQVTFEVGAARIHRYRGRVVLAPALPAAEAALPRVWHGEPVVELPALGGTLRFVPCVGEGIAATRAVPGALELRLRHGGERLRLVPGGPSRTLKNLFQEAGIPAWERVRRPLVYCEGTLACVPGVGVDERLRAGRGEAGVQVAWISRTASKDVLK